MPRSRVCFGALMSLLLVVMLLSACASPSAFAGAAPAPPVTAELTEPLETVEAQPTEGPDPVATEYALAALETPTPVSAPDPIAEATADVLKQMETYAVKPTMAPPPDRVNDLPFDPFVGMDSTVIDHIREIFAKGRSLGRNPRAFSKAGDSTIESPYFLGRFDSSPYNLGAYQYLQAVIDQFKGSYSRQSLAVRIGQHSWTLLNPAWADK